MASLFPQAGAAMTLLGESLPNINISNLSKPHVAIQLIYKRLRWHLSINGKTFMKFWRREDGIVLATFLSRLGSPATLYISPGPGHLTGERREF